MVTAHRLGAVVPLVAAGVGLVVTGRRLVWDQLALWAVKTDLFAAFDGTVRFVLAGGRELSPESFRRVLGLHTVALPLAMLGLLLLAAQRGRDTPTAPGT